MQTKRIQKQVRGLAASLLFTAGLLSQAQTPAAPPVAVTAKNGTEVRDIQTGTGHRFVCTDYVRGKLFIVNAAGQVEWEYAASTCNDVWQLPNGNFLFNTGKGVKEVTPDKKVVFEYQSSSEIYGCQRLPNGNTFVAECTAGRLLEVTPDGKIVSETKILPPGSKGGGHAFIRNARCLPNGNFLVAHYAGEKVCEYDRTGKVVWEIPAKGGAHSVIRLPNGNTLVACTDRGGHARVFEAAPDKSIVWEVKNGDLPGINLYCMTGFQRLANGNTVMSNWLGHGKLGKAPHVIEVTPAKQVVWTFADHATMKTISSIQLLDQGTAEVWH